jgi:hypothetical protein
LLSAAGIVLPTLDCNLTPPAKARGVFCAVLAVVVVMLIVVVMILSVVRAIAWSFVMRPANETIKKSGHSGFQFRGGVSPPCFKGLTHSNRRRLLSLGNDVVDGSHVLLRRSQRAHAIMTPLRDRFLKPINLKPRHRSETCRMDGDVDGARAILLASSALGLDGSPPLRRQTADIVKS